MNKVILIGRLANDPEMKYSDAPEPIAICTFTVAVDKPYTKNRPEGESTADFIKCVAFGRTAENIGEFFNKGNRIALQGRIQTGSYKDQQGIKKYVTEVIVDSFEFCENIKR